ncbi:MAG: EAL domain-containing protein [Gammaproteobacteria bacterium]|nr:EAL domain-containing protein [Gammaproteobacteria bacterium]
MKQIPTKLVVPVATLGLLLLAAGVSALLFTTVAPWWIAALATSGTLIVAGVIWILHRIVRGSPNASAKLQLLEHELADAKRSRSQLNRALASMNEAIFFVGPDGLIQEANDAAGQLLGCEPQTLVGVDMESLLSANDRRRTSRQENWLPQEAVFSRSDGDLVSVSYTKSSLLNDVGELEAHVYAVQNIEERKKTEKRIRYLARVDALTKMANRMQFQHLLQQAIARAKRDHSYLAILYLDVDRFKDINDTFGHSAGDRSLEIFSQRIGDVLPEGSVPGRLSGDEFCVLLKSAKQIDPLVMQVQSVGKQLLRSVGRPFQVQGEEIFMSTSIGAAIYPRDGENVVDLLRNADAALYQAKKAGGNCIEFYGQHVASVGEERLMLKSKLRRAFERNELRLDYQPKYRISDGRLAGVEALVRWDSPDRGVVYPSDFIPIAEESNLILQLGDWVLDRVCADFRNWQRVTPSPCRVSVNLSLRQLQQQKFLDGVRKTFREHGVSPTCFEFEITETTLMQDTRRTVKILDALYGMGLHLAIDDFGTGYSSLSALQQFPISTLKIDRSFVADIGIDRDNAAIVRTVIQMAESLKLDVVAEGVENEEQLDFLRANGCDIVQGHLFGDPISAEEVCARLVADAEGSGRYRALFA